MLNRTTNPSKSMGSRFLDHTVRKLYRWLGFNKGYNFTLFFVLAGALMGFVLARFQYLNIDGIFLLKTIPGDAVNFKHGRKRIGIILHLACILPAGFLACFQFVPAIRHKARLFHRLNGHVIILLFLVSNACVYIIMPTAAGGSPSTRTAVAVLATLTTMSITFAYISIKRMRIDLHRAWMLRTWVYTGTIISLRLISAAGLAYIGTYQEPALYDIQSCADIFNQYSLFGIATDSPKNPVPFLYPQCTTSNASVPVPVRANPYSVQPEQMTATMNLLFGTSLWLALVIHGLGVELYLWMTPAETERLKQVSLERRMKAGKPMTGSAQGIASGIVDTEYKGIHGDEQVVQMVDEHHGLSPKSPLL